MKNFSRFIVVLTCMSLALAPIGCSSSQKTYKPIPATPVEPQWQQFSRAPIVSVQETNGLKNFIVSDEFVVKAGQEHDFIARFKKWKTTNAIP